jgi:hypothetical protein
MFYAYLSPHLPTNYLDVRMLDARQVGTNVCQPHLSILHPQMHALQ